MQAYITAVPRVGHAAKYASCSASGRCLLNNVAHGASELSQLYLKWQGLLASIEEGCSPCKQHPCSQKGTITYGERHAPEAANVVGAAQLQE